MSRAPWLAPILACFLTLLLWSASTRAETLQAPVGGKPIALGDARVACGAAPGGWTLDADPQLVRPPTADDALGTSVELKVAKNAAACAASTTVVTLVAIARLPAIDATATTLALDRGQLELKGKRLKGARVEWSADKLKGDGACVDVVTDAAGERCTIAAPRDLPADPKAVVLTVRPAGARVGPDVVTFDAEGKRVGADAFFTSVARVVVAKPIPTDAVADVTAGSAKVALVHAESVSAVECTGATCELDGGNVVIRDVTSYAEKLTLKLHLTPRVFVRKGDSLESTMTSTVDVLHCPMSIVSPVIRGVDATRVVVRVEGRCAAGASTMRYVVTGGRAEVESVTKDTTASYVLLHVPRVEGDNFTLSALRAEPDDSVVAVAKTTTTPTPHPHATLELAGVGPIDFLPTNRAAVVRPPAIALGRLVVLPVEGAYAVETKDGVTSLHGVAKGSGFVSLRYAFRASGLPTAFAETDLATFDDALTLQLKEANVPATLVPVKGQPLVELVCGDGDGKLVIVTPGETTHIPFAERDSCRFIFHRERLPEASGTQKLALEVEVRAVDGSSRPEAHVRTALTIRPGTEPRLAWIRGVDGAFDRVTVRLAHAADETHYTGDVDDDTASAQWSLVMGRARARLYATTAIPTGLYRVADAAHSGILTLNFGVLSRLTWLDGDGHEGFLGLETGVVLVGLAKDTSPSGESLTQVATVLGMGLSVPIANRSLATETSVNLHAWMEYEPSRARAGQPGNPLGFVFGPSISIGNIGTSF